MTQNTFEKLIGKSALSINLFVSNKLPHACHSVIFMFIVLQQSLKPLGNSVTDQPLIVFVLKLLFNVVTVFFKSDKSLFV